MIFKDGDGEIANSLYNDHPPIDGVSLDRQDAFFVVNDFILGCMKSNDTSDEHHRVGKRKGRCEKSRRSKHVNDIHISRPRVVQLFVEHVAFHLVLLLVKVINAFKETIIEFSHFLFLSALQKVIHLKHQKWKQGS